MRVVRRTGAIVLVNDAMILCREPSLHQRANEKERLGANSRKFHEITGLGMTTKVS